MDKRGVQLEMGCHRANLQSNRLELAVCLGSCQLCWLVSQP